ncbi:MAG: glycosyltransferase [Candidatus Thorarchaeota archaeon]|jgi:glycosyltransferase involved in cell wall biosynthesis
MMLKDFKIYVSTLNEERLIPYTIQSLLNVFPAEQIEVIDIGSKDDTLNRIPSNVKVNSWKLPSGKGKAGAFFTDLKNGYSELQDWVLWVDGDEIYPTSSLLRMKTWVEQAQRGEHEARAVRLYWRILKESEGRIWCSKEYLSAGPKLFNSNFHQFNRAWPREVLIQTNSASPVVGGKKDFTGLWFWHGVLLKRSNSKELTARYKKRQTKQDMYDSVMTWEELPTFPWESGYEADVASPWTVFNMHQTDGIDLSWSGTELSI